MPMRHLTSVAVSAVLAITPLLAGGAAAIATTALAPEHTSDPPICAAVDSSR